MRLKKRICLIIFLSFLFNNCATNQTTKLVENYDQPRLSSAVKAAADDTHETKRKIDKPIKKQTETNGLFNYFLFANTTNSQISQSENQISNSDNIKENSYSYNTNYSEKNMLLQLTPIYGWLLQSGNFRRTLGAAVAIGFANNKSIFEFEASAENTRLLSENLIKSINKDLLLLRAGVNYKYYLTSTEKICGLYLMIGAAVDYLYWSYRNSFQTNVITNNILLETKTITNDGISAFELNTGVGGTLFASKYFNISTEITPALMLFAKNTTEGFENDIFKDAIYLRTRINLTFRF